MLKDYFLAFVWEKLFGLQDYNNFARVYYIVFDGQTNVL
jgi:hypothetical protein